MTMAYSDWKTVNQVLSAFDLALENRSGLFQGLAAIEPSDILKQALRDGLDLATNIGTEKARSELIVTPILLEVRRHLGERMSYFSGTALNVDSTVGLNGECDFILSGSSNQLEVSRPILTIVEAKNTDIKLGLGQCVAQMLGAQRFNALHGELTATIFGAVTTGSTWRFLRLDKVLVQVDLSDYGIVQLPQILGILLHPFIEQNDD